jgi:formiminoglutamate deiminase
LLPVFYAHGGFGGAAVGVVQRRFVTDPDSFGNLVDRAKVADGIVGIAPHSLRAATPDELRAILPVADGRPIHIHIAEQQQEVADCLAWSGRRPVEWLLGEMPVGPDWCLVHATHITDAECTALAASGGVAGLCPITEANLGDGIFPAAAYLSDGGAIGVGSDSNVRIDAAEELRLLEYGQRLSARARNLLASDDVPSTGGRLFRAAVAGGAQALVARSGDALLDSWVFAGRAAVDCVWRAGVRHVSGGRHRHREAVAARYRATLARLLA